VLDPRLDGPIADIYRRYNGRRPVGPDAVVRHPEWTRLLLERLGRPDHAYPVIMVTGSKGKGSTAWYLASVLEAHGLTTGFFASPHLVDNLERLRINGRAVSADRFLALYRQLKPHLDWVTARIPPDQYIGPVGVFAALAALWYAEEHVDVAVFETGRGARFDDVAEIRHEGAVISAILVEHRRELGSTREAIAWHKIAVVRPETAWAVMVDDPVLRAAWASEHYDATPIWDSVWPLDHMRTGETGTTFVVNGHPFSVPTLAHYAADNARRALLAAARQLGPRWDWERARDALAGAAFPGRAERLATRPPIFLDGAVTGTSAHNLLDSLAESGWLQGRILGVVGVPADKDWIGVADALHHIAPIHFVGATNPRLTFPTDAVARFPGARSWPSFGPLWQAVTAERWAVDRVVVLGTQSVVADVLRVVGDAPRLLDLHAASRELGLSEPGRL
jgi:dihydrofolate synthase/folylpolyglutamate synthase